MDTISFNQFYKDLIIIECYKSDGKNYFDSDNLKDIIDKLESIKTNIEKEIDNNGSIRYKDYLNAMKGLIEKELELNCKLQNALNKFIIGDRSSDIEYVETVKNILTKDLIIIPVIEARRYNNLKILYGQIYYSCKEDYTRRLNDLFTLLKEDEDNGKIIDEDIYKEEDKTLMRQLVLKFEHPDEYVDEEGDYNYDNMGFKHEDTKCELLSVARSFMFRSKTRRHFEYLNRVIPYEYNEMKESRKLLHSELKSLYKIFRRRMVDIPLAIAIKNE